jgi:SNF2 family DNA or RNA helicase
VSDELESLQKQLADLQADLAKANEVLAPLNDKQAELNAQSHQIKEAFKQQMEAIAAQQKVINDQKFQAQSIANKLSSAANNLNAKIKAEQQEIEKKKAAEEKAKRQAEQYNALTASFDKATMTAKWREWAKDHQIQAGHKITMDRYVILADVMGLGKTLESIITCDMAQSLTKEASPEFPWMGQEEEVWVPEQQVWSQKAIDAYLNHTWPFEDYSTYRADVLIDQQTGDLTYKGKPFEVGAKTPYIPYDKKNALKNQGFIDVIPGKYETQIVNSVTRPVGRRILYFCPAPLLSNVLEEWRNWAPHRASIYIGAMSKKERAFALDHLPSNEYTIIVNYEAWRRDKALIDKLGSLNFDTIIVDEAHMIKDRKSQAYKGVKEIIDQNQPEYVIPMTGTPILNRPQELFSILTLVNPKEFADERTFLWKYCEEYYPDGNENNPKWRFKPGGLDALAKKISTNFLRRTKEQAGIILPDRTIIHHNLDRDDERYPQQARAREHMKKFATIVIDENKALQATVMIALITRLRQIETWPAGIKLVDKVTKEVKLQLDVEESLKLDYVIRFDNETQEWEGLIPDNIDEERMVVFSQFKAPLHELAKRITKMGKRPIILDGDTPASLREEIRKDFDRKHTPHRADSKYDVLLGNYKAAGTGLNLTAATSMVILDREWNGGKEDQALDRIFRIGQTEKTTVNILTAKDTIDDWLNGIMSQKRDLSEGFEDKMLTIGDLKNALESGLL